MSTVTKPILLDETGKEIKEAIIAVKEAILGSNHSNPWSITIDTSSSNPQLSAMNGDKASWLSYRQKIGRYLLKSNGTAKKLSRFDSSKFLDGSSVDETQGNVMVRIPRLYYRVDTASNLVTLYMCEQPFANSNVIDEQWVGAYMGYVTSGKLVSRSGVKPTHSMSISQFWNAAQVNGSGYGLNSYDQRRLMVMMELCEYLSLNSQATLGNGMTGDGNNWCSVVQNALTGATKSLGDSCGNVAFTVSGQTANNACHTSLFGIEDTYGWFWEMIQGCYFGSANNSPAQTGTEIYLYDGNRMPTSAELASTPAGTYRQLTRNTSDGWVLKMILGDKFDIMPSVMGGSSTSGWCDYNYANNTGQLLLWGGLASYGSYDGFVYSRSHLAFSDSGSALSARLAYYGIVTIED